MLNFLSVYVYTVQINLKSFYNNLRQKNNFEQTLEDQKKMMKRTILLEQISNRISDPDQPFFAAMCHVSNFGIT